MIFLFIRSYSSFDVTSALNLSSNQAHKPPHLIAPIGIARHQGRGWVRLFQIFANRLAFRHHATVHPQHRHFARRVAAQKIWAWFPIAFFNQFHFDAAFQPASGAPCGKMATAACGKGGSSRAKLREIVSSFIAARDGGFQSHYRSLRAQNRQRVRRPQSSLRRLRSALPVCAQKTMAYPRICLLGPVKWPPIVQLASATDRPHSRQNNAVPLPARQIRLRQIRQRSDRLPKSAALTRPVPPQG